MRHSPCTKSCRHQHRGISYAYVSSACMCAVTQVYVCICMYVLVTTTSVYVYYMTCLYGCSHLWMIAHEQHMSRKTKTKPPSRSNINTHISTTRVIEHNIQHTTYKSAQCRGQSLEHIQISRHSMLSVTVL